MYSVTIHDRMLAVYRKQLTDQIPIGIYTRYLPRGSVEREVRNMGLGVIEYYPVVSMVAPPWHLYPGYLSEVKGAELSIKHAWENGNLIERRTYETPIGTLYQDIEHDHAGAGSEHIKKHYIATHEDYKIMQYLVENTVIRKNEDTIRRKMQDIGDDGILLGRVDRNPYQKCLIELAGPERFLIDLHTHPEPVLELMEAMSRKMDEVFELTVESAVEVIWQPDNITSDMTPPNAFKEYCLPFYQKHGKQVKQAGKPYVVHIDGRIKALKDLVNAAPFDIIESLSFPEIGGDLTLTQAREAFPDKVIIPNFPSNWCLKSDDEIEGLLENLLLEAGTQEPCMLQVSEDIPVDEWARVLPVLCKVMHRHSTR
jgi:uroporphyrinogen-III decarboxylase